jgi:hypothetical protein
MDFNWVKELNTFFGYYEFLWEKSRQYTYPFPSGRKQFVIENEKTGGFRRFRLQAECRERQWCERIENLFVNGNDAGEWCEFRSLLFSSEDGIECKIYL